MKKMDLNIVHLYKHIVERQKRRTQAFDKVMAICHNHIRNVNKVDAMKCLFRVPEFIWGIPPYDLSECIKHIIGRLEGGGFHVKYYFPNVLFISWDIADLEQGAHHTSNVNNTIASTTSPNTKTKIKANENLQLLEDKKPKLKKKPQGRFTLTLKWRSASCKNKHLL